MPDPPAPVSGPDPLYVWAESDTGQTYVWDGAAWVLLTGGSSAPPPTPGATPITWLVSGGQVVWESAYTFRVSAADYYINTVAYTSAEATVTLGAADATLDRLDVIALDTLGAVVALAGTAAATPSEPSVDPAQYLKLAIVSVPAATVAPPDVQTVTIYAENAGTPTEWAWTSSGASIVVASASTPHAGTTTIEGTSVVAGVYAQGTAATPIDPNAYDHLLLFLRSKASWNSSRGLLVTLRLAGVLVGATVQIRRSGTFGFDSTNTAGYQMVAIPIVAFAVPQGTLIDQVRLEDFGGAIGFFADDLSLQVGATSGGGSTSGLSQEQADARYRRLETPLVLSATADVSGDLPLASLAPASAASRLLGRGSASGAGDFQELTISTGLALTGTVLTATASGSGDVTGPASSVDDRVATFDGVTGKLLQDGGKTLATVQSDAVTAATAAIVPVDILTETTGFPGGTTNFLRADQTFAAPPAGGGGVTTVGVTVDGGGVVVTTGGKGYIQCPISGTITGWTLLANAAGDVEFDVTLDAFGGPYTTSIVASAPPALSGVQSDTESSLGTWTTSVTAGDVFGFAITGTPATLTRVTLQIAVTP